MHIWVWLTLGALTGVAALVLSCVAWDWWEKNELKRLKDSGRDAEPNENGWPPLPPPDIRALAQIAQVKIMWSHSSSCFVLTCDEEAMQGPNWDDIVVCVTSGAEERAWRRAIGLVHDERI